MGCDIHLYKEKHIDGQWVAADEWTLSGDDDGGEEKRLEVAWNKRFADRNYQLFGLLCRGVRSDHPFSFVKRGMPVDACKEVAEESESWGRDGHSHSYLYLHELKSILDYCQAKMLSISGMKDRDGLAALRDSIASGNPDWDLLWPYCQWTTKESYENFEIEVPASLYFEKPLKKIIDSFNDVDGDNHRIVFFFDN